jgi:rhombotail lipoprotein
MGLAQSHYVYIATIAMTSNTKCKVRALAALTAAALLFGGCGLMENRRVAQGTSVMQFLYPAEPDRMDFEAIPKLSLPLRVGVAFVPPGEQRHGGSYGWNEGSFSEARKRELMEQVAARFRGLPYVKSIDLIPSSYLRTGGGFTNLDQVRSMFGVDVMALISYDQVQFTDEGALSLAYWTIVGAYVVKGEKNDTQTLMEAAVYDIPSRRLLFRAPGSSQVKGRSTPVNLSEQLRQDGSAGFDLATVEMIKNLEVELASFEERIKQAPDEVEIVHRPGYTGAGGFGGAAAAILAAALAWAGRFRKQANGS